MKKAIVLLVLVAAAGGGAWYYLKRPAASVQYRLAKVTKGNLRVTVSATGTIQPFLQVQVGTQVSGTVQKLLVDFNSKVTAGQWIAQIDPAPYQSIVDQMKANLTKAESDVGRVQAGLTQADKELIRARELAKRELISGSDLDAAIAQFDSMTAQLKVAQAAVKQSEAAHNQADVNLKYTKITSPIDGVVISRNVDVGQTVAASLSAPTIYVIADEMKTIQVQASVAEADIGRIVKEQKVSFTVDAYRETTFKGRVSIIRLSPTTVQNVVTYTVMIEAENAGGKLLPGMTANATFEVAQFENTVKIPNSALRFAPPAEVVPDIPPLPKGSQRVWINGPTGPVQVLVTGGASDGAFTQLVKGDLEEGTEVIVGILQEGQEQMNNPFNPSRPPGKGGGR